MAVTSNRLNKAARTFLSTGAIGSGDPGVLAEACDRVIRLESQKSATRAVSLAKKFVRHARPHTGVLSNTSLRALGWALRASGAFEKSRDAYLKARTMSVREASMRARIDRILIDIYMYLGDFKESRRRARLSIRTFQGLKADDEVAKTRVNYANLLHRQDRHREARRLYEQATSFFEAQDNKFAVALCRYNLANTLVQLFETSRAEGLYRKAASSFKQLGFDLYAIDCQNGLAWLHMLQGDYHIALEELVECEKGYKEAGQPRGVILCQLDRAEAYLGLNLFADARNAARDAGRRSDRLHLKYEAAKAAFFDAKASLAMGRKRGIPAALEKARDGFSASGNRAFLGAVDLLAVQLDPDNNQNPNRISTARQRFSRAQLPLWEAVCDLQLLSSGGDENRSLRRLARNPAVKVVPHLYAQRQTLLGDRAAIRGRLTTATTHWSRAAEVLDAVRAKLPPMELRDAFSRRRTDPYLRLIGTELNRDPAVAAAWSERYKTAGVWATPEDVFRQHPARKKAEDSLADLARRVTALAHQIGDTTGARTHPVVWGSQPISAISRQVRHDLAVVERISGARQVALNRIIEDTKQASLRQSVIQFHISGDDLIAFVHHRKHTHCHRFVDGARIIDEFMGRWRFLLGRNDHPEGRVDANDLKDENKLFRQIGDWLWTPLEISVSERRLLILPEGRISNLPWQAVAHQGGRLGDRHDIVLSPSLQHHLHAGRSRIRSRRIEVFVGRTDGLTHIDDELAVLTGFAGWKTTIHNPSRREDIPHSEAAALWHYAGHAQLRADNPFYSSLLLEDGPLFAADFRLRSNRVGLVMLAGCRTGQHVSLPGEESTGLVRSLLEMGARNVVASHWAVSDVSASLWMKTFYSGYLDGSSVREAAREAATTVRKKYPSARHWAVFSLFGAG